MYLRLKSDLDCAAVHHKSRTKPAAMVFIELFHPITNPYIFLTPRYTMIDWWCVTTQINTCAFWQVRFLIKLAWVAKGFGLMLGVTCNLNTKLKEKKTKKHNYSPLMYIIKIKPSDKLNCCHFVVFIFGRDSVSLQQKENQSHTSAIRKCMLRSGCTVLWY